jgi:hypothetical protein
LLPSAAFLRASRDDEAFSESGGAGQMSAARGMRVTPIPHIVLGPDIVRWLSLEDLNFPDSGHHWGSLAPTARGLTTDDGWLVFHRCQVALIVPDEVHSGWHHRGSTPDWQVQARQIDDSEWLASFSQQHLTRCQHFVIDLRDNVVEVICEGLLFGPGAFDLESAIDAYPVLADAYFWRACQRERRGDAGAIADFERVAESDGASFQSNARDHLTRIRRQ